MTDFGYAAVTAENVGTGGAGSGFQDLSYAPGVALHGLGLIVNQSITTADIITSVRINPAAENLLMTRVASVADITGEFGRTYGYQYPGVLPAGTLTIRVNRTENTSQLQLVGQGFVGDVDVEVLSESALYGDPNVADPQFVLPTGGRLCAALGGMWSGVNAPANIAELAGMTRLHDHDFTNDSGVVSRRTSLGTTDFTFGYTANTTSFAMVAWLVAQVEDDEPTGEVTHIASVTLPLGTETTGGSMTIPACEEFDLLRVRVTSRNHDSGVDFVTCEDTEGPANPWNREAVGPGRKSYLFWKRATPATAGKVITIAGAVNSCAAVLTIDRGAYRTGSPITNLTIQANATNGVPHAGFTPAFAKSMICLDVFNRANDNAVTAPACTNPGVLTTRAERLSTGGDDCAVFCASAAQAAGPTATGNATWTQANNVNHSMFYAIRPEPIVAPPPEQTAAQCKAVAFNSGTGAAATTVSVTGVGFTPKAVQFFAIGRTELVDAAGQATAKRMLGFAANCAGTIRNRCGANISEHNKAAGAFNARRMGRSDACILMLDTAGAVAGRAAVTAFTADGCTLTIGVQFASSLRIIAIFYGGTDLTDCAIGTLVTPTAGGLPVVQDVTGLGFTCVEGKAVGFLLGVDHTADNAGSAEARLGLGAFVQAQDGVRWSGATQHGATETLTRRHCSRGRPWGSLDATATTFGKRFQFAGWITDGFRLAHDEISANADLIYYLVLKGGRWALADGLTSVLSGNVTLSGLGIGTPVGGILASIFSAGESSDEGSNTTDMGCFGAFSSPTDRYVVAQRDQDHTAPSTVATRIDHARVYASISTLGEVTGAMDLESFDPNGVTFHQDVIEEDEAFAARRFFWCVLFGRTAGFVGDPTAPHKHWRIELVNEPGEGPPVTQLEVVARRGKVGAPGSTMTNPARLHPGITHISPAAILNGGTIGAADGEVDIDIAMMTLPAGYSPDLATDKVGRQHDTLFDSDGILKPTVRQGEGGRAMPLVKGSISGFARHGDDIDFEELGRTFLTVPLVKVTGGRPSQLGDFWGTRGEVDLGTANDPITSTTLPQYPNLGMRELVESGGQIQALLQQKHATRIARSLVFDGDALSRVGDVDTINLLTNAPSADDSYLIRTNAFWVSRSKDGKPYTVIITYAVQTSFDVASDDDWKTRASGSYIFETSQTKEQLEADQSQSEETYPLWMNHPLQGCDHRIIVPGLSGDGTDGIRLKVVSVETIGLGESVTSTDEGVRGVLVDFVTAADTFASATPGADDYVFWEAYGYV